jgi:hypothetical protein
VIIDLSGRAVSRERYLSTNPYMKPGPSILAQLILESVEFDAAPVPLVELITQVVLEQGWELTQASAREKAEVWCKGTLSKLQHEVNALLDVGRPPRITFNSSSAYMVQGACFVEPRDPPNVVESKTRRLRYVDYSEALGGLTPRQFELLCGKLIELLGVDNPTVSRSSADEGIDFYGKLSFESIFFPDDLTPTIQKQLSIWLVGQAKHYKNIQSGTSELRDLVGAVALGRASAFGSVQSPLADLRIRVGDPVFSILITTGTISSNAWRLLKRSGIIGLDGEMVAAFLADRGAGLKMSDFDNKTFVEWVES